MRSHSVINSASCTPLTQCPLRLFSSSHLQQMKHLRNITLKMKRNSYSQTYRNLWRHSGFQTCSGAGRSGPFCSGNASSSPGLRQGTFQPASLHPRPGGRCSQKTARRHLHTAAAAAPLSPPPSVKPSGSQVHRKGHICRLCGPSLPLFSIGEPKPCS